MATVQQHPASAAAGVTPPVRTGARPRLPDFILGGAMKCGTTSLHHLLGAHPRVMVPDPELFFFDCDDLLQHPWAVDLSGIWSALDYDADFDRLLPDYASWFSAASADQLVGEDTTSYLASSRAPARIARLLPDVKMIFMLRDPVDRAYSQYWHEVRAGQAFFDFETTLRRMPGTILQRGRYREQLEQFRANVPEAQIHVVVFEDFVRRTQEVTDEVCAFLGLEPLVDVTAFEDHRNRGDALRFPALFRVGSFVRAWWAPPIASRDPRNPRPPSFVRQAASAVLAKAGGRYPPMSPETRGKLAELYARSNRGLSDLVGRDLRALWPSLQGEER